MTDIKKMRLTEKDLFEKLPGKPVWYYLGIYLVVVIALFHNALFSPSKLIYGTDLLAGNLFFRHFFIEFFKSHGCWPLWDPYIHGGFPFVDGMHGDIFYIPSSLFYMLFNIFYAWGFVIALHVFFSGFFMYLFLKDLNIRGMVAFLGGLLYMMAPLFISLVYAGHNGKMFVITLTPLMFFIFHRATTRGKLIYYILLSFVMLLVMTTPHMQMAYFLFATLGAYFIVTTIQRWRKDGVGPIKPTALFLTAVILGMMLSLMQFLTPYQYLNKYSMRTLRKAEGKGYRFSTSWSLNPEEIAADFFPEFCGDNVAGQKSTYWGHNYFKLNSEHFSIIAIFLSVLGIGLWQHRGKWFFFGTIIVTLIFSLGANTFLFKLFYLLPGIKNFRAPGLIAFLTCFSTITLGAMGLESFLTCKKDDKKLKKTWKIYTYITAGYSLIILLLLILQMGFFKIWFAIFGYTPDADKMRSLQMGMDRITIGALISLAIVLILYALLKFYLDRKIKPSIIILILATITFVYMWSFNSRYIITIDPKPYYAKTPIIDFFKDKQKEGPFRVLVLPQTLRDYYLAYHGIEELSTTQLHGNHLASTEEFIRKSGKIDVPSVDAFFKIVKLLETSGLIYQPSMNMLNSNAVQQAIYSMIRTRFIYSSVQDLLNIRYVLSSWQLSPDRFRQVKTFGKIKVYENLFTLPRAFPIYRYVVIPDEDDILATFSDTSFDYRSQIIFDKMPDNAPPVYDDSLRWPVVPAKVYDIDNFRFKVDVEMLADGFLFLSENYYPAWKAYENGRLLPTLKADFTFRAIPLKKGFHTVECRFENNTFSVAFLVSKFTFVFLALSLIFLIVKNKLKNKTLKRGNSEK